MSESTTIGSGVAERERVIRRLRGHERELRALGVSGLALFGSVARGEAGADSDVDVLIEVATDRRFSLFDLSEVRLQLCELLGRDVGVTIASDLDSGFRARIEPDLAEVF